MKKLIHFAGFMIVAAIACEQKNNSIYENCCGTMPTADSVLIDTTGFSAPFFDSLPKYGTIFIPNIFTPDTAFNFPLNAIFMVFGGDGVYSIVSEIFTDENGETMFSRSNFQVNDVFYGWNGVKPDGSVHYGPFNYEVKVRFIDGQEKTYTGKACAFKCNAPGFPNENLPDCFFPEQNNGYGTPDISLPQPVDCF